MMLRQERPYHASEVLDATPSVSSRASASSKLSARMMFQNKSDPRSETRVRVVVSVKVV